VADVVAARYIGERFLADIAPPPCFLLLVRGQLRPAAEFHTARLRSLAAFGCALPDQVTFELGGMRCTAYCR
jgi:hypothetical protein